MQAAPFKASLKFLANADEPLVYIPSKGGGDATQHVGNFVTREVIARNGRREKQDAGLDVEGFKLVHQETRVEDFHDDTELESIYHAEVKSLIAEHTGAQRIEIFDDTRRSASLARRRERRIREPADIVHNDYTARSGVKRLRDHFAGNPEEADRLRERRFAIINVWRSIAGPVLSHPLVLSDASTIDVSDLVSIERRAEERAGELQVALHNPAQRWYCFPRMQMDEALLFKTFDSATDGRARFTPHTSCEVPGTPRDAALRESIETRCLVFF